MDNPGIKRLWQWLGLAAIILMAAGVAAYFLFRFEESRRRPRPKTVGELIQELRRAQLTLSAASDDRELETSREALCNLLAEHRGQARPAVELLLELAQQDPALRVRLSAIHAIGSIGTEANAALPVLIKIFTENPDPVTRSALGDAIPNIIPAGSPIIAKVLELTESPNASLANHALAVLGALGQQGKLPESLLMQVLSREKDPERCLSFVNSLGGAVPKSREVAQLLEPALKSTNDYVSKMAVETIGKLGAGAQAVIPTLIHVFKESESPDATTEEVRSFGQRYNAIEVHKALLKTFGLLGADATAAIPALVNEYQNPNNPFRFDCAVTRLQIDHDCSATRSVFATGLEHKDPEMRNLAMGKLGEAGRICPDLLDFVIAAIRSTNRVVRLQALNVLPNFTTNAVAAEGILKEASADPNPSVRRLANMNLTNLHAMQSLVPKRVAH